MIIWGSYWRQKMVTCMFLWLEYAAAAAKSLQSCPTLCDPIDGSSPGSPVPGILQARILEWVAISFSNAWKGKVKVKSLSCVRLLATPWIAAYQAPLSMGFARQECWSGMPLPSPDLGISWSKYLKTLLSSVKLLSGYQYHPNPRPRKIPVERGLLWESYVPGLFAWSSHNSEVVGETPEKATATHSSTLAWKILGTEDSGRLQSMGSLRVGHDWAISLSLFTFMHWKRKWQPTLVFLPGESQGQRSLVGCHLWDRTESDTTEVT